MRIKLKPVIGLLLAAGISCAVSASPFEYHARMKGISVSVAGAPAAGAPSTGTSPTAPETGAPTTAAPAQPAPAPVTPITAGHATPGIYTVTVPAGYTSMTVKMWGGGGDGGRYVGNYSTALHVGTGGGGGFAGGTLAVTPGTTFQVVVGSSGYVPSGKVAYGGGGQGDGDYKGGGYSGIFVNSVTQSNALFVAGGGGGGGRTMSGGVCSSESSYLIAGGGGGLTGGNATNSGGMGGTQTAGGPGKNPGLALKGGASYTIRNGCGEAGGGGGGYFGGGSGTVHSSSGGSAGGGGSGFVSPQVQNPVLLGTGTTSAPANSADPDWGGAGQGGGGGNGLAPGKVIIVFK